MNWADAAIVIVVALSILMAAASGFFVEIFSLAGAVVGYVLAAWGCYRVGEWFLPYVKTAAIANLAGFLTILFAVMIVAGMVGRLFRWAMKEVGLRWVDRLLGAAFGVVRGLVIVTVVVVAVAAFSPESQMLRRSQLASYFLVAGRGASWIAPSELRQRFRDGVAGIRNSSSSPEDSSSKSTQPAR